VIRLIAPSYRLVAKVVVDGFANAFQDTPLTSSVTRVYSQVPQFVSEISVGAYQAAELHQKHLISSENEAGAYPLDQDSNKLIDYNDLSSITADNRHEGMPLVVTARVALKCITTSLIDASPSELCLVSLKNVNAFSNWSTDECSDSTFFITVADLQVDNMLPNAAFPVAVCRDEEIRLEEERYNLDSLPPLLVMGLSFAPRHKSGIMVRQNLAILVFFIVFISKWLC
jgi:hypothetical protein